MLDINTSHHYMQFQGKLMNQTWKNVFGPILTSFCISLSRPVLPFLKHFVDFTSLPLLNVLLYWKLAFFATSRNLAPSVTRYYGQLLSCTMPKKTNDPILRKTSNGLTDRRTDGQTERRTD